MATLNKVSEQYTNRDQSWIFTGIYRNREGIYQVEVRKNAYEGQSHATVSAWSSDGWKRFASVPVEEWYRVTPSYQVKRLTPEHEGTFIAVRDKLLTILAKGMWEARTVEIREMA